MSNTPKDCDLSTLPKLLEVYVEEGPNTVVCIHPYEFFKALYPNEPIDGDPGAWGVILCDTLRHIAKAHRQILLQLIEADATH